MKYISYEFSDMIKSSKNFTFTKFGDGEYNCMNFFNGSNIDGDNYTKWLGEELVKSYLHLSSLDNTYIGEWPIKYITDYFNSLNNKTNWVNYHSVMNASVTDSNNLNSFSNDGLFQLVKSIRESNRNKIIVSNIDNIKLKDIFKSDHFISVSKNNWSKDYNKYESEIINLISDDSIILTASGMCSKVLISNLLKFNINITCIDIGSGFDLLATGKKSRPWSHSYEDEIKYYENLL